jgi:acetyltransferase
VNKSSESGVVDGGDRHSDGVERLLNPRSVAIIGASSEPTRIGGLVLRLLARHGFSGQVFPVNPKHEEIAGLKCYPTIDAIDRAIEIDVAIINLPANLVVDAVEACGGRAVKSLVVITSGFAELGPEGKALQDELTQVVQSHGMAMCGPNCAGIANFVREFVAYGTTNFIDLQHIIKGSVAIMSASGGFGNTIFTYCQERLIGVSHLIGLGNEAVTDSGDFMSVLADDPDVSVVIANLESIRDPTKFFEATDRASARRTPVVVLKGGRSEAGQHAIMTHTAALGGSPQAFAGAFSQHGVIQVTDLDELADTAMLLCRSAPTSGNRVGIFSLPGGGTGLLSDNADDFGFAVPDLAERTVQELQELLPAIAIAKNPLDPTAGFGRDSVRLQRALKVFAADPNIDVVLFFPLASQIEYSQKLANDLIAIKDEIDKPLIVIWTAGRELEDGAFNTLHAAGVPLFRGTASAFRAMARVRDYALFLERTALPAARDFGPYFGQSVNVRPNQIDDAAIQSELGRFGIRFPRRIIVNSVTEAVLAVEDMGECAFKISSPDIPHRTEADCVRLDVSDATSAAVAYNEIIQNAVSYAPDAQLLGVEVQEMMDKGLELLLGVRTDDQLGPVITVGIGGILAEIVRDVVQRPVPISRADAREMLAQLTGAELFDGFRGGATYDRDAVTDAMLGLSAFADAVSELSPEIDLNPLIVLPDGGTAVAVDCLARFTTATA